MQDYLIENKRQFIKSASYIKNYENIDMLDVANMYINTTDDTLKSACFSCIMLHYWDSIFRLAKSCNNPFITSHTTYNWLVNSVFKLFKYKKWLELGESKDVIDRLIMTSLTTERLDYLRKTSTTKSKINYTCLYSLDATISKYSDDTRQIKFGSTESNESLQVKLLINDFINNREYEEAVIVDSILNNNVFVYSKDIVRFSKVMLVTYLLNLDSSYIDTFINYYDIDYKEKVSQELDKLLKKWKQGKRYCLLRQCKKVIRNLKNDEIMKGFIC